MEWKRHEEPEPPSRQEDAQREELRGEMLKNPGQWFEVERWHVEGPPPLGVVRIDREIEKYYGPGFEVRTDPLRVRLTRSPARERAAEELRKAGDEARKFPRVKFLRGFSSDAESAELVLFGFALAEMIRASDGREGSQILSPDGLWQWAPQLKRWVPSGDSRA